MSAALQQGTQEWLDLRRSKIGASDAPVIMGVSPWMTPYQLWESKVGLRTSKADTDAMRRGRLMEETARRSFEKEMGIIVFPAVLFHKDHDWMMASLDGIDIEHKTMVEIKCPGREDHQRAKDGQIPEKYWPQLQHQMEVCGLEHAYYYSWTEEDSAILSVSRSDDYVKRLVEEEKAFFYAMDNLEAPVMTDRDYVKRDDDIWRATAKRWKHAHLMRKAAESEEEEMRKALISMASGSNCKGEGIQLSRTMRRGHIDYKSIPELENIDVERYRKSSLEVWKICHD